MINQNKINKCLVATLILASTVFASCSTTSNETAVTDTSVPSTAPSETETEDTSLKTALPDDLDFGGKECDILNIETLSNNVQMTAEQENGETINDAIYRRNLIVEDALNINLTETYQVDSEALSNIRKYYSSGDNTYEINLLYDRDALTLAQEGGVLPIQNLQNIDLTREYWAQDLNEDISIGGNLYFAYGDFNLSSYDGVNALLVNLEMNNRYDLPNPYDMVLDGTWTLDKLHENMLSVVQDLNGDGKFDDADQYGITSHPKQVLPNFWIASGLKTIEKDSNDLPYLALEGNEHFATLYEKILDMMWTGNVYYNSEHLSNYADNHMFINGQVLYNIIRIRFLDYFRNMDINYAIIPFPKETADQDRYYTRFEGGEATFVMDNCSDTEMVGAALELLACESKNILIPAYYDEVLKGKYARDERSADMLDIIYSTRICDFGDNFWSNYIRDGVFAGKFAQNDRNLQSTIKSIIKGTTQTIKECIECFEAID